MRTINLQLLKDRSGLVIHWLEEVPDGKIDSFAVLGTEQGGRIVPVKRRIACRPEASSDRPRNSGRETFLTLRSDDVRAVTCPECKNTPSFHEKWRVLQEIMAQQ